MLLKMHQLELMPLLRLKIIVNKIIILPLKQILLILNLFKIKKKKKMVTK